ERVLPRRARAALLGGLDDAACLIRVEDVVDTPALNHFSHRFPLPSLQFRRAALRSGSVARWADDRHRPFGSFASQLVPTFTRRLRSAFASVAKCDFGSSRTASCSSLRA